MKTLHDISVRLKAAVTASGLTHAQISESSGVQRMTLHRMLSGKHNYSLTSLLAVAFVLKLDLMLLTNEQAQTIQRFSLDFEQKPRVPRKIDAIKDL